MVFSCDNHKSRVPVYLKDYSAEYLNNPRKVNLHWFTDALISSLSPHALISFKQGANGDEDFSAPERNASATVGNQFEVARMVYEKNKNKPKEICNTLQPHAWGYDKRNDGKHKTAEELVQIIKETWAKDAIFIF